MSEAKRKAPDWSRIGTVEGYAEYLRKRSGAICVMVIRPEDSVLAIDGLCAPGDAGELIAEYLPRLLERVEAARKEKRAARLVMGPNRE